MHTVITGILYLTIGAWLVAGIPPYAGYRSHSTAAIVATILLWPVALAYGAVRP